MNLTFRVTMTLSSQNFVLINYAKKVWKLNGEGGFFFCFFVFGFCLFLFFFVLVFAFLVLGRDHSFCNK